MNKILTMLAILLLGAFINLQAQIFVGLGSNIGGAIPTEQTEGSSAKLYPGAYLALGYKLFLTERLSFSPQISLDFKLFDYFATQKKDTIVEAEVLGVIANVPTYYQANIHGRMRLGGVSVELPIEYRISKKSGINLGIYSSTFPLKSDEITINVKIGEGGLLPDIDSSYNNKSKINSFDAGLMLGGHYLINDNLSIFITGYRSLTRFYKLNTVKNDAGNDIPFYYTQARFGVRYRF